MALELMSGVAKGSITDVKKSPMEVFKKSSELKQGIYILNRNDIAGVVLDQKTYEAMTERIEELEEMIFEAEALRRIEKSESDKDHRTYTVEEVIGHDLSTTEYSEHDGWE